MYNWVQGEWAATIFQPVSKPLPYVFWEKKDNFTAFKSLLQKFGLVFLFYKAIHGFIQQGCIDQKWQWRHL